MATDANGNLIFGGGHGAGLRSVGSYQVSGHPFITGSTTLGQNEQQMIEFPYVSKSFTVINTNDSGDNNVLRVHFQSGSTSSPTVPGGSTVYSIANTDNIIAGKHYITVDGGAALTFDVKCAKFYISQTLLSSPDLAYEVFAELTGILAGSMYHLTGSGITDTT